MKIRIQNRFGVIPNALLADNNISLKAKGLYGYIQSKPDNWDFSANRIKTETKDGRDGVLSGLKELEEAGYLMRKKFRNQQGQWDSEYYLYDIATTENPDWGKDETRTENPTSGNPTSGNTDTIKEIENKKDKEIKIDIYIELLEYWNDLGIIKHIKTPANYEKTLDRKLKTYTLDEVRMAMKKYSEIVLGKEYWFTYKWGIRDFLSRENGLATFFDCPKENYLKRKDSFNTPQNAVQDEVDIGEFGVGENISVSDFLKD